jgi:hypothetical protein
MVTLDQNCDASRSYKIMRRRPRCHDWWYSSGQKSRCRPTERSRLCRHRHSRHTAAMELLQAVIALWLGHESMEIAQVYLHPHLALKEAKQTRFRPPMIACSPSLTRCDSQTMPKGREEPFAYSMAAARQRRAVPDLLGIVQSSSRGTEKDIRCHLSGACAIPGVCLDGATESRRAPASAGNTDGRHNAANPCLI